MRRCRRCNGQMFFTQPLSGQRSESVCLQCGHTDIETDAEFEARVGRSITPGATHTRRVSLLPDDIATGKRGRKRKAHPP